MYEMGNGKLFNYYLKNIHQIYIGILDKRKTLVYNSSNIKFIDIIDKFLFSVDNGLFTNLFKKDKIWLIENFINKMELETNLKLDNNSENEKDIYEFKMLNNCDSYNIKLATSNEINLIKYKIKELCKMVYNDKEKVKKLDNIIENKNN